MSTSSAISGEAAGAPFTHPRGGLQKYPPAVGEPEAFGCWPPKGAWSQPVKSKSNRKSSSY